MDDAEGDGRTDRSAEQPIAGWPHRPHRRALVQGVAAGLAALAWPTVAACSRDVRGDGALDTDSLDPTATPTPTPAPAIEPLVAADELAPSSSYVHAPAGLHQTENDGRWYSLNGGVLTRYQRLADPSAGESSRTWAWTWAQTDSTDIGWEYDQLVSLGHGVLIGRTSGGSLVWHRDLSVGRNPMTWSINDGRVIAEGWQLDHLLALHSGHLLAVDPDGSTWWHQWLGDRWHPASGSVRVADDWVFDEAAAAGASVYSAANGRVQVHRVILSTFIAPDAVPVADVSAPVGVDVDVGSVGTLVALDDSSLFVAPAEGDVRWRHVGLHATRDGRDAPMPNVTSVDLPMHPEVRQTIHAAAGPVDLAHIDLSAGDSIVPVDAYWFDQSVDRGGVGALAVSTAADGGRVRIDLWDLSAPTLIATQDASAGNQGMRAFAVSRGCDWAAIPVPLPADATSGLYSAAISPTGDAEDGTPSAQSDVMPVEAMFVPLIVRPSHDDSAALAVLANTNTWNAYNRWGGASQYTNPFGTRLSFRRPNRSLNPTRLLGTSAGDDLGAPNHHLLAGEVRFLSWLRSNGYGWHSWSDTDLHDGALDLDRYRALVIHSHPEYWTTEMFDRVAAWLDSGGTLVNLGGNGLYERVELMPGDSGEPTMVMRNGHPEGERDLLRFSGRRERSLLGVAFEGVRHDGDPPELQKGQATDRYAPYRVIESGHRFFDGTGLTDGDLFVTVDGELGGAGWEVDTSWFDGHEASGGAPPENLQLLAQGVLGERAGEEGLWTPDFNAHMTYYDHPGGGWVFSAGSMVFTHWMVEDPAASRLIRNVLDEAVSI